MAKGAASGHEYHTDTWGAKGLEYLCRYIGRGERPRGRPGGANITLSE